MVGVVIGTVLTAMLPEVPAMDISSVSVAVMNRVPTVLRVALNEPTPLVRVVLAGRVAAVSVPVKFTLPVYHVAVWPAASRAVTVNGNAVPTVGCRRGGDAEVRCRGLCNRDQYQNVLVVNGNPDRGRASRRRAEDGAV